MSAAGSDALPARQEQELRLKVKTLQPATYEVTAAAEATVQQLKEKLVPLSNIPTERQRLIFRGAVLQDTQGLSSAHIEDGHTLHLVERPEGVNPSDPSNLTRQQQQAARALPRRINIGMIDTTNGAIDAFGGLPEFLQNFVTTNGQDHMMQIITHPPMDGPGGGPQAVHIVTASGASPAAQPTHQLAALNTYLQRLETDPSPRSLPRFSMVSQIGRNYDEEAAFLEMGRTVLASANLPDSVETFVNDLRPSTPTSTSGAPAEASAPMPAAGDAQAETQGGESNEARDPRRNGLDGSQPADARSPFRNTAMSPDMLRFSSLTVAQLARQCIRHMQARAMPSLAAAVNRLHEQGVEGQAEGSTVLEQAREISNTAYQLGSLMLELSLAATNLSQAAIWNSGPLLCAEPGFLSPDGNHSQVPNRVPPIMPMLQPPFAPRRPGQNPPAGLRPQAARPGTSAATGTTTGSRVPRPPSPTVPGTATTAEPGSAPIPQPQAGANEQWSPLQSLGTMLRNPGQANAGGSTPLSIAHSHAMSRDPEYQPRHMRMPVRLPGGHTFRVDMSSVVNAVESMVLSAPPRVITRVLQTATPVRDRRPLRELLTDSNQTDAQRRHIYLTLLQPVLQALEHHLQTYFQHLYRVAPVSPDDELPAIRPTRRAASRAVPSLTQATPLTDPLRDIFRIQSGDLGRFQIPGRVEGQVQMQVAVEGVDVANTNLQFPAPAFGRAQQPGRDTSASPQGIPTQIPQANQSDRLAPRINRLFPEPTGGSVRAAAAGAPRQQAQAPGPARPHLSPDRNPGHPPESQATPSGDVQAACSSADPERGAGAGNERVSASTSARPVVTVPGVATPGDARAGAAPSSSQEPDPVAPKPAADVAAAGPSDTPQQGTIASGKDRGSDGIKAPSPSRREGAKGLGVSLPSRKRQNLAGKNGAKPAMSPVPESDQESAPSVKPSGQQPQDTNSPDGRPAGAAPPRAPDQGTCQRIAELQSRGSVNVTPAEFADMLEAMSREERRHIAFSAGRTPEELCTVISTRPRGAPPGERPRVQLAAPAPRQQNQQYNPVAILQSLLPWAPQGQNSGRLGQNSNQQRTNISASQMTQSSGAGNPASNLRSDSTANDIPELDELPEPLASEWRQKILADRQRQADQARNARPLSPNYMIATGQQASGETDTGITIAQLD